MLTPGGGDEPVEWLLSPASRIERRGRELQWREGPMGLAAENRCDGSRGPLGTRSDPGVQISHNLWGQRLFGWHLHEFVFVMLDRDCQQAARNVARRHSRAAIAAFGESFPRIEPQAAAGLRWTMA